MSNLHMLVHCAWKPGAWVFADPPDASSLVLFGFCCQTFCSAQPPSLSMNHVAATTSIMPLPMLWQQTQTRPNRQPEYPAAWLSPCSLQQRRSLSQENLHQGTEAMDGNMQRMFGTDAFLCNEMKNAACWYILWMWVGILSYMASAHTLQSLRSVYFFTFTPYFLLEGKNKDHKILQMKHEKSYGVKINKKHKRTCRSVYI